MHVQLCGFAPPPPPHRQWVYQQPIIRENVKVKTNLCHLNQAQMEDGETLQRTAAAAGGGENTQGVKIPDPLPGFPSRMCSPFIGVTSTRYRLLRLGG